MTMTQSHRSKSLRTPTELRRQAAHAREELGRMVGALASKERAVRATGRAAATARTHRTAWIGATGILAAALLARRSRRSRPAARAGRAWLRR
ncbi:hypothetical protein ACFWP3_01385 [Streptomyces sp. NPDC058525]|uniref:hypothetical protein n=1 Tax=Streptomyces sp. NPDC058525 TaxID=3346538 RepID=UPI00364C527D